MAKNTPKILSNWLILHIPGIYNSTTYYDVSGNGNNGTGGNVTNTRTLQHNVMSSTSTSTYITIANESQFDFDKTSPFSISIWVKVKATGSERILICKMANSNPFTGWVLSFTWGNVLNFGLINTVATNHLEIRSSISFTDTSIWNHFVVTYDWSSAPSWVKMYCNWTNLATSTSVNNLSGSILNNIAVELWNRWTWGAWASNQYWTNTRVYNRVLSQSEAQLLFASEYIK